MFKKIEIWILFLIILMGILFSFFFGMMVRQELVGAVKFGKISKAALYISEIPMMIKSSLIGMDVDDFFPNKSGFIGKPNKHESYLLLSKYDGDINSSVVDLIDLQNFETIYRWKPKFKQIIEAVNETNDSIEFENFSTTNNPTRFRIFNPLLTDDQGLIFHHNSPLVKIDKCSNLVWLNSEDRFHHSNEYDHEHNIWSPSHIFPFQINSPYIGNRMTDFYDDGIAKFSKDGELLFNKSVANILINNGYKSKVFGASMLSAKGDPIHLNDIQPVINDSKYWKKGDVFLSLRNNSSIILYRPSTDEIIKLIEGPFSMQHDINIIDNETISVFDNNVVHTTYNQIIVDKSNRIVTYNFRTNSFEVINIDSFIDNKIETAFEGRGSIQKNGDIFVEESSRGRILYLNSSGDLEWEYISRSENDNIYRLTWSRILDDKNSLKIISTLRDSLKECN